MEIFRILIKLTDVRGFQFDENQCTDIATQRLISAIKQNDDMMIIFGAYSRLSMCWYSEALFMPEMLLAHQGKQMHKQYRALRFIYGRNINGWQGEEQKKKTELPGYKI